MTQGTVVQVSGVANGPLALIIKNYVLNDVCQLFLLNAALFSLPKYIILCEIS